MSFRSTVRAVGFSILASCVIKDMKFRGMPGHSWKERQSQNILDAVKVLVRFR